MKAPLIIAVAWVIAAAYAVPAPTSPQPPAPTRPPYGYDYWFLPSSLVRNTSDPEYFHEFNIFFNATRLTYVSTHGGYFENWTVNESISPRWIKSDTYLLDPPYGLRALVFYQPSSLRLLIAFRGTDLTNDLGGLCDRCADQYLWGGVEYDSLPSECQQFPESTLDYLTNAAAFANEVAFNFFLYDVMFTGHSLGAGLALCVSAMGNNPLNFGCAPPNAGAIVFSTPGYISTLMNRSSLDLALVSTDRALVFVDQWDPIWVGCNNSVHGGFIGRLCEWQDGTPSSACVSCDSTPAELPMNSTACNECMLQRHSFAHYESLRAVVPVCYDQPRQECDGILSCWTSGWMCTLQ